MTRSFTKTYAYGVFKNNELLSLHLKKMYAQGEILKLKNLHGFEAKIIKVMIAY